MESAISLLTKSMLMRQSQVIPLQSCRAGVAVNSLARIPCLDTGSVLDLHAKPAWMITSGRSLSASSM